MKFHLVLVPAVALLVGACTTDVGQKVEDKTREWSAKVAAEMFVAECKFSIQVRQANMAEVQDRIGRAGHPGKAIAQDCDGDGVSDF